MIIIFPELPPSKGRVSPPRTHKGRQASHRDSLEEDFENLLKDEDDTVLDVRSQEEEKDSYLDDFEALLAESASQPSQECDEDQCDIEADFDALLEKENVVIQNPISSNNDDATVDGQIHDTVEDKKTEDEKADLAFIPESDDLNEETDIDGEEKRMEENDHPKSSQEPVNDEITIIENEQDLISNKPTQGDEDIAEQEPSVSSSDMESDRDAREGHDVQEDSAQTNTQIEPVGVEEEIDDVDNSIKTSELESFDHLIDEKEEETPSLTGKKVIVPTMEILDQETLDKEILEDSREAELLIQLKHLNARVEAQDTLLAELKEENTVLKIQNQNLLESLNSRMNSKPTSLFRKSSKEYQSLEYQDLDETTERKKLFLLEQELEDQKEVNKQLKAYVGDVLINIIVQNPDILEKKSQQ